MQRHRIVLASLAALALTLAIGRAVAEEAVTLDEFLKEAKACQADKNQCTTTIRLEVLGLSVKLPSTAGWKSELRESDSSQFDLLSRSGSAGNLGVILERVFGDDSTCPMWTDFMVSASGGVLDPNPAVRPKGWSDDVVNSPDGNMSITCFQFPGGIIRAKFAGPNRGLPPAYQEDLRIALEAIGAAAKTSPPRLPQ